MPQPLTTKEKLDVIRAYDNALGPTEFQFVGEMERYAANGWSISDKRKAWIDRIYEKTERLFIRTGIPSSKFM